MNDIEGADNGTTHAEGCHTWGPRHYECAMARIGRVEGELAALRERIDGSHVYRVDYKDGAGMLELDGETDFDILERLNGRRVALVPVQE